MPKRNIIWVLAIVAAGLAVLWAAQRRPALPPALAPAQPPPVQQSLQLIRDNYYKPLDGDFLGRAAVAGMVKALDPFCAYIPPEQAEGLTRRVMDGLTRGTGLELEIVQGRLRIAQVLANSPADRAGLLTGEQVLEIDGKAAGPLSLKQARLMLDGPPHSTVRLKLLCPTGQEQAVSLARGEFPIESIEGLYRDDGGEWAFLLSARPLMGYIRIREFVKGTDEQFQTALRRLGAIRGLVIDLRDNPGGSMEAAVAVCDLFVREGVIVSVVGRDGLLGRHQARSEGDYPEIPLVVLTNARTASAAEILAGSLGMHGRAVLVGTRTRGKGTVQSMLPLPGGLGQVSLTTATFYLGRLGSIGRQAGSDRWGIDPHMQVIDPAANDAPLAALRRRLCALRRAALQTATAATAPKAASPVQELLELDVQLRQALALLGRPAEMQALLRRAAEQAQAEDEDKPPPAAAEDD